MIIIFPGDVLVSSTSVTELLPLSGAMDSKDVDDEGLLWHYDVVLCGTGLVQSLVAAALSRAGKSILHLDGSDYYGELDAVWSLPYLLQLGAETSGLPPVVDSADAAGLPLVPGIDESTPDEDEQVWHLRPNAASEGLRIHTISSRTNVEDYPLEIGSEVSTPFGTGSVQKLVVAKQPADNGNAHDGAIRYASVVIGLGNDHAPCASTTTLHVGIPLTEDLPTDLPSLRPSILSSHKVVPLAAIQAQTILENRSRSFALDITPALLYCAGPGVQALLESQVSEYLEFKSLNALWWYDASAGKPKLQAVPCSKSDVFGSDLLSPLEKRRLMKFLQLALDFAVLKQEESAAEDAVVGDDTPASAASSVHSLNERRLNQGRSLIRPQNKAVNATELQTLQDCIARNMSFEAYLKSEAKLSDNLTSIVQYALSLILSEQQPIDSDASVSGSTRLSVGMAALCRHMASLGQFGVTAFLYPLYGSGELPQAFCRSAAVYGATYLLRRRSHAVVVKGDKVVGVVIDRSSDGEDSVEVTTKRVGCDHIVVPKQSIVRNLTVDDPPKRRVFRRMSILRGKCLGDTPGAQQQQLVVFPPFSVDPHHPYAIHALLLDDHVKVAPSVPCGCSVVHLTTVAHDAAISESLLTRALDALHKVTLGDSANPSKCQEIFHASFSYQLDWDCTEDAASLALPSGWHAVARSHAGVAHEEAYEQARAIFQRICPNEAFLHVAPKVAEKAVKRQVDDDEAEVLQKAMEMIQSSSTSNNPIE